MKLSDRLKRRLAKLIPTRRVTAFDVRTLQTGLARTLDADRVIQIMQSAENGDLRDMFALYRDIIAGHSHLQGRFSERKDAVVGDVLVIGPQEKTNKDDKLVAEICEQQVEACDSWEDAMLHLLDSGLYPVSICEKVFKPGGTTVGGRQLNYRLKELVPVPHDLLDFTEGDLRIYDVDEEGKPLGTSQPVDPNRYIVHRGHTLTLPDQWGGPLRSLIWWYFLGTQDREWWARFLDRYGAPFLVGHYDQADDDSRSILMQAFSLATTLGGIVVSRSTDVELKQAATKDAGEAFEVFHRVANQEISKLILGQTLSSDAQSTGLGSGVANEQGEIRQDKRQADARRLGNTIRCELFRQLITINGLPGSAPKVNWGSVSVSEMAANAEVLDKLGNAGLEVADEGIDPLSEKFGFPIQRKSGGSSGPIAPGDLNRFSMHSLGDLPPAVRANERVIRGAAADLVRAFGDDYAKITAIAAGSTSAEDFMTKLEAHCASLDPLKASEVVENALLAIAANGSVVHAR
jgi:phage gp29-like protein